MVRERSKEQSWSPEFPVGDLWDVLIRSDQKALQHTT